MPRAIQKRSGIATRSSTKGKTRAAVARTRAAKAPARKPRAATARKTSPKPVKRASVSKPVKQIRKQDRKPPRGNKASPAPSSSKLLELGLLLDCTSSMHSWIERAKTTLKQIVTDVASSCDGLKIRICFVGYRDHCDRERFAIHQFTDDVDEIKKYISSVQAVGGGDFPEDVVGGLRKCLDQNWSANSSKQVFHIFDAPCHGKEYHDGGWDSYPNGCPNGLQLEPLMREFKDKSIAFTCIKLNEQCNKMIKVMQENHPAVQITDLAHATQTKSADEVTKMFVDSASFILRATVGGKAGAGTSKSGKASTSSKKTPAKAGKYRWDPEKLEVDDIFSCISYLKVNKIEGNTITVNNHHGGSWLMSKDILERDMWSADHFDKEIKCTMSDLSEIIQQCKDTIFKVQFKTKVDEKGVLSKLKDIKLSDLKKTAEVHKLSKSITEG